MADGVPVTEAQLVSWVSQHDMGPALLGQPEDHNVRKDLRAWLAGYELGEFMDVLVGQGGVHRLEDMIDLTGEDLKELGLPMPARRRFARGVADLHEYLLEESTRYSKTMQTVWTAQFTELRHAHPAAMELLELASFLAPDDVDGALLVPALARAQWPRGTLYAWLTSREPLAAVVELLEQLERFSLVVRGNQQHFAVHRLVQAAVRHLCADSISARATAARALVPLLPDIALCDINVSAHWLRLSSPFAAHVECLAQAFEADGLGWWRSLSAEDMAITAQLVCFRTTVEYNVADGFRLWARDVPRMFMDPLRVITSPEVTQALPLKTILGYLFHAIVAPTTVMYLQEVLVAAFYATLALCPGRSLLAMPSLVGMIGHVMLESPWHELAVNLEKRAEQELAAKSWPPEPDEVLMLMIFASVHHMIDPAMGVGRMNRVMALFSHEEQHPLYSWVHMVKANEFVFYGHYDNVVELHERLRRVQATHDHFAEYKTLGDTGEPMGILPDHYATMWDSTYGEALGMLGQHERAIQVLAPIAKRLENRVAHGLPGAAFANQATSALALFTQRAGNTAQADRYIDLVLIGLNTSWRWSCTTLVLLQARAFLFLALVRRR